MPTFAASATQWKIGRSRIYSQWVSLLMKDAHMKRSAKNGGYMISLRIAVMKVFLVVTPVLAEAETPDIQMFLPLFERNSIARKMLDVSYSFSFKSDYNGKMLFGKQDMRLVFDAETGKYREEMKQYGNLNDTNAYEFRVNMWDGKEVMEWVRQVFTNQGYRALGADQYEDRGVAVIHSQPQIPSFIKFYFDASFRPFVKSIPEKKPKLGGLAEDTIIIETGDNKFEFSKKTSTLKRLDYNDSTGKAYKTYEFSSYMDCSGIWIPLRIVESCYKQDGSVWWEAEFSVDSKMLRVLDKVDTSVFSEALPAGCSVSDLIRKKEYTVTTADTLPPDVDALKQALEKMLEQAQEQAAEKK